MRYMLLARGLPRQEKGSFQSTPSPSAILLDAWPITRDLWQRKCSDHARRKQKRRPIARAPYRRRVAFEQELLSQRIPIYRPTLEDLEDDMEALKYYDSASA